MPGKKSLPKPKAKKKIEFTNVHIACFSILILLLAILNLIVYSSPRKTNVVYAKDNTPLVQAYYLKGLLKSHPDYREGWVSLAKLEYTIGNMDEVQFAIDKVYEIDPNYKGLTELQKLVMK
jgi:hypothetical protein